MAEIRALHVDHSGPSARRPAGWMLAMTPELQLPGVVEFVAHAYGLSVDELLVHRGTRAVMAHRRVAMAVARAVTGASYPAVGRAFDRDHTTVIHAVRRVAADPSLRHQADVLAQAAREELA